MKERGKRGWRQGGREGNKKEGKERNRGKVRRMKWGRKGKRIVGAREGGGERDRDGWE